MNNAKPDTVAATIAAVTSNINWSKLDGPPDAPESVHVAIQKAFQSGDAGRQLTRWLSNQGWDEESQMLKGLEYPKYAVRRLTPGIDDILPFVDPVLMSVEPFNPPGASAPLAFYYDQIHATPMGLWSCIGLATLRFFAKKPIPEFEGRIISALKSVIVDEQGRRLAPTVDFSIPQAARDVAWLCLDSRPTDSKHCLVRIHC